MRDTTPRLGPRRLRRALQGRRRRHAAVLGLCLGAALGAAFAWVAAPAVAERAASPPIGAAVDATHLPPLLTTAGEDVELRYDINCVAAVEGSEDTGCDPGGTVFVRPGSSGPFRALELAVDRRASEGRFVARVPAEVARSRRGFTYYAVLRGRPGEAALTLPAGGAQAPHRSLPLARQVDVALGSHTFGDVRAADERVAEARWGNGALEVGLERGLNVPPVGGASFHVDDAQSVFVLDQVHGRVLRWSSGTASPYSTPVSVDGTIADLCIASDGTMYVLEGARAGRSPALRTFDRSGRALGVVDLGERTASQVKLGPSGPLVLQQPSGQWSPVVRDGNALSTSSQLGAARAGRLLPGGDEVIVLRLGNEIRAAIARGDEVRRSWRVTSSTPIAEVQLAEPVGDGLLLVFRVYAESRDEFLAMRLGSHGAVWQAALDSADWAEAAPLSRFRLSGSSLYQLGSTPAGLFVDRFDLEVS